MSVEELRDKAKAVFPGHSVQVASEAWYHRMGSGDVTEWQIGLLPGLNGKPCQLFRFPTSAELAAWIVEHEQPESGQHHTERDAAGVADSDAGRHNAAKAAAEEATGSGTLEAAD